MARVNVSIAAEKEIRKYSDNNYLWVKNVCNIDLYPHQVMWMDQMDRFSKTLVVASPRVGKTFAVEMHGLKSCAVNGYEDYRLFAPIEPQAAESLKYQIDAVIGSPALSAYIETRLGRKQLKTTGYTFVNRSNAKYFGQNGSFEGVNATIIRGEEFDDIEQEVWKSRILPRGMAANRNGLPTRIRVTGVIQGRENLYNLELDSSFESLLKVDVYDGAAFGILDKDYVGNLREIYTDDQWLRIALVQYVESRNFFWSAYLRRMQKNGAKANLVPADPGDGGGSYESAGRVAFGLDMGAQGESATSSKYSLQVVEQVGFQKRWLYGHEWESTVNPGALRKDIVRLWDFFRPVGGYADAFDANLVAQINDDLYGEGIISFNRMKEHAENTSSNWQRWKLRPVRFAGAFKHQMFKGLQGHIHQGLMYTPLVIKGDALYDNLKKLITQLENIRSKKGGASYLLYEMIKKGIGDDNVDALAMGTAFLDEGKMGAPAIEAFGSGQKMAGLTAPAGVFYT